MQQFQNSMIVQDTEVKSWLAFSYDGKAFLACRSLKKGDSGLDTRAINEIVDNMTSAQIDDVSSNIIVSMWPEDDYLHSLVLPQAFDDKQEPVIE